MNKRLFTSESVTEGHPDKVADQISDAILDAILAQDPQARVACETAVNTGLVLVFGDVTTRVYVDIQKIFRNTVSEIGYHDVTFAFVSVSIVVFVSLFTQSSVLAHSIITSIVNQAM